MAGVFFLERVNKPAGMRGHPDGLVDLSPEKATPLVRQGERAVRGPGRSLPLNRRISS